MQRGRLSLVQTKIGSVLSLPFEDATIDCVWCANVAQYLTKPEFDRAIAEFKRVLKPGGTLAIKEHDTTIAHLHPLDPSIFARLIAARRSASNALGSWSGTSMPSLLRNAGLTDVSRKGWLVERWAPMAPYTRGALFSDVLVYYAGLAAKRTTSQRVTFRPGKRRRRTPPSFSKTPIAALVSFSC